METRFLPADLPASLFQENPDAIAVYDRDGSFVSCNAAALRLTGYTFEEFSGTRYTDHIFGAERERVEIAFQNALEGCTDRFESTIRERSGAIVPVDVYVFPARLDGEIAGVFVQARDAAALRSAEQSLAVNQERIRQLYLAAAARGQSLDGQIENTLSLGCRLFGFDYGYVTRFKDSAVVIQSAAGDGAGVRAGMLFPKRNALSRLVEGARESVFIRDLDEPPWNADPARYSAPWRSYYAAKLVVNGADYGALVFAGRVPHENGLAQLDRDLLEMMALFVSAAIERSMHAERIEQLAFYDSLTGLPNRALFADRIDQTLTASKRYNRGFSVMYLDLDAFKEINDRFGHPSGDLLLRSVAERLMAICRESDTIARFGGDEFVILQPVVNGAADAADLAAKIVEGMQQPFTINGNQCTAHTSIGIALFPNDGVTAEDLMEHADRALYRAKRAGRNRWQFFAESDIAG